MNFEKIGMGEIQEAMKKFVALCANCNHNKVSHQRTQFRDEGRTNGRNMSAFDSECKECDCKEFIEKK